jgi:hypothetical protein
MKKDLENAFIKKYPNNDSIFYVTKNKNIDEETDKLFAYFKKNGFPHYDIQEYDKNKELSKLTFFNIENIYKDKDIKQTMHSLGFLWCFFPNWIEVKFKNQNLGLLDLWNDDKKLKTLIKKTYKWELKFGNGIFTINRLRQNAKVYLSKQSVSNFRPTAAKYIYEKYGNKGVVWDMSSGWGGRLFGFLGSNCNTYIGTEPCKKTFKGLENLKNTYKETTKKIILHNMCAEDFIPKKESLDLCFTSPPYFDCERYSDEENQSYIKYPEKNIWLEKFLRKLIVNCYYGLKKNSHLILNIANTTHHKWIEEETCRIAKDEGFVLIDINFLILSSIAGKGEKKEPIFIFKKI